jgi:hypothetical protein
LRDELCPHVAALRAFAFGDLPETEIDQMVVTNLKDDLDRLSQPFVAAGEAAGISIGLVNQAGRKHYFHDGTIGRGG